MPVTLVPATPDLSLTVTPIVLGEPSWTYRRIENLAGLSSNLYVATTGDDVLGNGSVLKPYASITRAIADIGTTNSVGVTVNLVDQGPHSLPRNLSQLNLVTIKGPTPAVTNTLTVDSIVQANEEGLFVNVTGTTEVLNSLKGTLVRFVSSNTYGWVYRNSTTVAGVTTLYLTQDHKTTVQVPVPGQSIELLSLGADLQISGAASFLASRAMKVQDCRLVDTGNGTKILRANATDKVTLVRCFTQLRALVAGFGGSFFLTTCYLYNKGSGSEGIGGASRGGNLRINQGSVIDGSQAGTKNFLQFRAGSSIEYKGISVLTGMNNVRSDGTQWAAVDAIDAHDGWILDGTSGGVSVNNADSGDQGGGQYPNFYGSVLGSFLITATGGPNITLGPSSNCATGGAFGVNAVSADGGTTNIAQWYDGTIILNGSPAGVGWQIENHVIGDPGNGAAIPTLLSGSLAFTVGVGVETNTLANPTSPGDELVLSVASVAVGGSRVVTCSSAINLVGNTIITLATVNAFVLLRGVNIGGTVLWRVIASEGATLA